MFLWLREMKVKSDPVVAIAGVTGALGGEFIATLDKRRFPVGKLKALASARSAGRMLGFRGEAITVEELTEDSFVGVDIALFSAGSGVARKYAPIAVKAARTSSREGISRSDSGSSSCVTTGFCCPSSRFFSQVT